MIQRWELGIASMMEKDESGDIVLYEDHLIEINKLKDKIIHVLEDYAKAEEMKSSEIERLREALVAVRLVESIEQANQIAKEALREEA